MKISEVIGPGRIDDFVLFMSENGHTVGPNDEYSEFEYLVKQFLYGKKEVKHEENLLKDEKKEKTLADHVGETFAGIDFSTVSEVVWTKVLIRSSGKFAYAIDAIVNSKSVKRMIVSDKDNSFSALSILSGKMLSPDAEVA